MVEIGQGIEEKYWNEMEIEKKKALDEQAELLKFMFEKEKREVVKAALEEEQQLCRCIVENLKSDFEEKLQSELAALETKMLEDFDKLLESQREEIEKEWQEKLDVAVQKTVQELTEKFLKDLETQKEELKLHYEAVIK